MTDTVFVVLGDTTEYNDEYYMRGEGTEIEKIFYSEEKAKEYRRQLQYSFLRRPPGTWRGGIGEYIGWDNEYILSGLNRIDDQEFLGRIGWNHDDSACEWSIPETATDEDLDRLLKICPELMYFHIQEREVE